MPAKVTPYANSTLTKKQQIAAMFNNIAWRYDFLNRFLSFGIDRGWRKKAIQVLAGEQPQIILDIATGTGDLAIEAMKLSPAKVFGIDISEDMLRLGRKKIRKKNLQDKIELLEGDSESLIFEEGKFDAITVAFGVRNFENLEKGLREMFRVLKPGGTAVILEFSQPGSLLVRKLYHFYSSRLCPFIGKIVSKDKSAYAYLYESVEAFPYGEAFKKILEGAGFDKVHIKTLTFGVASIYVCKKYGGIN
jgi:demethylmenaquinone methyltransferase/2-methoxy-6-polyprenyl-1,4-benzoquinol methylase